MRTIEEDAIRYGSRPMPNFQCYFRKIQISPPPVPLLCVVEIYDIQVVIHNLFKNEPYRD